MTLAQFLDSPVAMLAFAVLMLTLGLFIFHSMRRS